MMRHARLCLFLTPACYLLTLIAFRLPEMVSWASGIFIPVLIL
jgi:hypothetical protein